MALPKIEKGVPITGKDRDEWGAALKQKYEDDGATIRELAESTGRSFGWMHKLLREAGTSIRGQGGDQRSSATVEAAEAERAKLGPILKTPYENGASIAILAARYGKSKKFVAQALREAGVKIRPAHRQRGVR